MMGADGSVLFSDDDTIGTASVYIPDTRKGLVGDRPIFGDLAAQIPNLGTNTFCRFTLGWDAIFFHKNGADFEVMARLNRARHCGEELAKCCSVRWRVMSAREQGDAEYHDHTRDHQKYGRYIVAEQSILPRRLHRTHSHLDILISFGRVECSRHSEVAHA